jgi:hypothetical protein
MRKIQKILPTRLFTARFFRTRRGLTVVLAAAAVLVLGTLVVVRVAEQAERSEREHEAEEAAERAEQAAELPAGIAHRLRQLQEATPGSEFNEGPANADADAFFARAYPATDIPLTRVTQARNADRQTRGRGFPTGRSGNWASIGPTNALYQFTDFRTSSDYVPNAYLAGGRVTALVLDPSCSPARCRLWIAAAGGGIWRTDNALAGSPTWKYLSESFGINAIGSITLDPNDPRHDTLWVGTGEANSCGSGCSAGVGLYKSTNGGATWTGPYGGSVFAGRGVGTIAVVPGSRNTLYASTGFAVNGHSSVCCTGATRVVVPGAAPWGVYKSIDGGATWTYLHNGSASVNDCGNDVLAIANNTTPCSPRGVRQVVLDPSNPNTIYASSYARGVWRSTDAGATWTQIKPSLNSTVVTTLPWIAVTTKAGKTRMYVSEGHTNADNQYSRLFRTDDAAGPASPAFTDLTSADPASPGYGSFNFCTGQCWYDNVVFTPPGHPDVVYLLGSYLYAETGGISNGRGVLLSTDAGTSFTDESMDATDPVHPNGVHPDQHAIVVNPANPYQFWEGSDGGVIRSSGQFADMSAQCGSRSLEQPALGRCQQLLSRVPTTLAGVNKGLPTLQFQSLSVSPFNANIVQGGTQDNGTFQTTGSPVEWPQVFWGDGGQSGFDAVERNFRFHTYFDASPDVNFSGGALDDWNWIGDPIYATGGLFYVPIISDPRVSRSMFVGTTTVLRTKTAGMGSMSLGEFRAHCNEFTGDFAVQCGDWQPLGPTALTDAAFGDRAGGAVAAVERTPADTATVWAATTTGRVFVSHNADADPASAVTFARIDSLSPAAPGRFVSGIYVDPTNPNHAWVSYSGYSAVTPATPGHVFEVTYNPAAGTARWTDRSYDLGDLPATDVVYDKVTGDLYASSDFGVYRLRPGRTHWNVAAPGMPNVEVAGLTIQTGARKLFAASHGLSAWSLTLTGK